MSGAEARLYLAVNEADQRKLDGVFDTGMQGSVFERAGFELQAARKDECGLTVGFFMKSDATAARPEAARPRAAAPRAKPRKGFS
ncbi:unnamed protein product [Prorocentrum cordatum]|uniref:Uncharacterized protein n=1 Tax=Prorocentrum cordatum TaxID=2364126 RepID=A0ABN9VCG5_9DINO|nr:unnamed protein product [Polarella glacialis]